MKNTILFAALVLSLTLSSCGGGERSATDTGSASFGLKFEEASAPAMKLAPSAAPADICSSYGIDSISGTVYNSSNTVIATGGPWACSAHQGTITNIPPGSNLRIAIQGTVAGSVVWQGETTGATIYAGQDTNVGAIPMTYTGNDTTRPTVTAATPTGTNVPLTSPITVTFSEFMVSSTIDTTSFTLKNGSVAVPGSVSYNSTTKTATFTPTSSLSNSVIYSATVTTDVTDMAANKMLSLYAWDFTTEAPPGSAPSTPTNVSPTAADKQVTISWTAVSGATSYNIYWSTITGVTKTNGTQITGATSPYTHTALTNGTTYYYVVTAVNSYGESGESSQLSATPTSGSTTDTTSPSNPTATSGYDGFGKASSITNGNWYNYTAPYFEWSGASDSGSGVAGYYVYFGTSITADPAVSGTYQATANYTVSATLTSGSTYYLLIKAKDSSGNIAASAYKAFTYNYDSVAPSDGNMTVTNGNGTIALSWSGFLDNISGISSFKLVYSTTGTPASCSDGTQIYTGTVSSYTHIGLTNDVTYYYRVCAIDNAGSMSTGVSASAKATVWTISYIDMTAGTGSNNPAMTIDANNKVHVSYTGSGGIIYATNVSGSWTAAVVDSAGGDPGAIAIDSNNKVHIVALKGSPLGGSTVKEITNSSGTWVSADLAYSSGINHAPSIAIDSGNKIHVAYCGGNIEYFTNASGSWNTIIIDVTGPWSTGTQYTKTSIVTDANGKVHITYSSADSSNSGTWYATNTSGSWVKSKVDSDMGYYNDIAVDVNGKAHISYSQVCGNVKYATNSSGAWVTTTIYSPTNCVSSPSGSWYDEVYTSIAVDSNSKAHISYFDTFYIYNVSSNFDLKYGSNETGLWVPYTLDGSSSKVGAYPSIAIDSNNKSHIVYYDGTNGGLKYATNQ